MTGSFGLDVDKLAIDQQPTTPLQFGAHSRGEAIQVL